MIKIQSFSGTCWSTNSMAWSRKRRMLMDKTSINSADSEANRSGVINFHCMQMTLVHRLIREALVCDC